jgi:hypothetical protein
MFRYEAHVVALGIVVLAAALLDRRLLSDLPAAGGIDRRVRAAAALALLAITPLADRAVRSAARVPGATANIYEQQYQMGLFLKEYYAGAPVALNDIGAPSYLAGVQVMDLVGLASMDVAAVRRAGLYSPLMVDDLARDRGVGIAIVYDRWFPGRLPAHWVRAGSWTIRNPVVVGSDTVTFYATRPDEYATLVSHLREFEHDLPPGVTPTIIR